MKRDHDDTDFREVRASYERRAVPSARCPARGWSPRTRWPNVVRDAYPVTPLHTISMGGTAKGR
ncbi:MAG: hypothetical protein M3416_05835 [Acidobacteriota bacterium]|nr:hypothetical protein [Acidobacteriota bacterium]